MSSTVGIQTFARRQLLWTPIVPQFLGKLAVRCTTPLPDRKRTNNKIRCRAEGAHLNTPMWLIDCNYIISTRESRGVGFYFQ